MLDKGPVVGCRPPQSILSSAVVNPTTARYLAGELYEKDSWQRQFGSGRDGGSLVAVKCDSDFSPRSWGTWVEELSPLVWELFGRRYHLRCCHPTTLNVFATHPYQWRWLACSSVCSSTRPRGWSVSSCTLLPSWTTETWRAGTYSVSTASSHNDLELVRVRDPSTCEAPAVICFGALFIEP